MDDYLLRSVYAALAAVLIPAVCVAVIKLLYPIGYLLGSLVRLLTKKPASPGPKRWRKKSPAVAPHEFLHFGGDDESPRP